MKLSVNESLLNMVKHRMISTREYSLYPLGKYLAQRVLMGGHGFHRLSPGKLGVE